MRTAPVGDGNLFIFVGHAVPAVPFRAVPVLPCRGGRLCPPWMTAAPRRAGPVCPAIPSAPRCHSEFVGADDSVRPVSLARESAHSAYGCMAAAVAGSR